MRERRPISHPGRRLDDYVAEFVSESATRLVYYLTMPEVVLVHWRIHCLEVEIVELGLLASRGFSCLLSLLVALPIAAVILTGVQVLKVVTTLPISASLFAIDPHAIVYLMGILHHAVVVRSDAYAVCYTLLDAVFNECILIGVRDGLLMDLQVCTVKD